MADAATDQTTDATVTLLTLADIRAKAASRGFRLCRIPGGRYGIERGLGGRVLADYADLAGVARFLDRWPVIPKKAPSRR